MLFFPVVLSSPKLQGQATSDGVKWINGKQYSTHQVLPKETWTGIARENAISVKDLQVANAGVTDLKIGQVIYVPVKTDKATSPAVSVPVKSAPVSAPVSTPVKATTSVTAKENYIYHTVKSGETLYHISKLYKQSVSDIQKWNNLSSNNITLGSNLIVGKGEETKAAVAVKEEDKKVSLVVKEEEKKAAVAVKEEEKKAAVAVKEEEKKVAVPASVKEEEKKAAVPLAVKEEKKETATTAVQEEKNQETKAADNRTDIKSVESAATVPSKDFAPGSVEKVVETGVATWLADQELNQNKFYALHRTAPIGTIIKVTNRMNNNSVFVKVVGLLPATGDNDNIIIKITSAAAQRIGALDQKFTAELSYGITH